MSLEQGAGPAEMAVGAWEGRWLWRNLGGGPGSTEAPAPDMVTVLARGPLFTQLPSPCQDLLDGGLSFSKKMGKTSKIMLRRLITNRI